MLAERRRGLWAGSVGVRLHRCPGRWSWSVPAIGWISGRGCIWSGAEEGRGCEAEARDGVVVVAVVPLNRR